MSAYKTETARTSAQLINSHFVRKIDEGRTKEAQAEGSAFIRSRLRQESWLRQILPPQLVTDDEIERDAYTDLPKKIVEIEPDSYATFVPFKGTGRRTWFKGKRYEVFFGKVESQHFTKSKFELMTYQNDIRKILTDNSVKDMADEEDRRGYETLDAVVTQFPNQVVAPTGGLTANNVVEGFKNMLSRKMPIGKILCTEELYMDALKLPATSIGDKVASRHFDEGLSEDTSLWGFPVVTTIKNDIVPNNEMWIFSPQNYLGNFFLLQDATLYIEQRADMVEFWSYSAPGIGIANTAGITKIKF